MCDMRNFKGEMQDENKKARPRYASFRRRNRMGMGGSYFSSRYESHDLRDIKKIFICFINGLIHAPV